MFSKYIRNRASADAVTEIAQGASYSRVAPPAILLGHLHNQLADPIHYTRASRLTSIAAVIFLSDRSAMPSQQCFRVTSVAISANACRADSFGFLGEPDSLLVGEPNSAGAELLAQDPVLLAQVLHGVLLSLIRPSCQGSC